ncbi:MAG: hypothetical protein ACJAYU_002727 [Bradymonadia bacterium]
MKVDESVPSDERHVVVAAIAILDPWEDERIRTLATANGDRGRESTTTKCRGFWESAAVEP